MRRGGSSRAYSTCASNLPLPRSLGLRQWPRRAAEAAASIRRSGQGTVAEEVGQGTVVTTCDRGSDVQRRHQPCLIDMRQQPRSAIRRAAGAAASTRRSRQRRGQGTVATVTTRGYVEMRRQQPRSLNVRQEPHKSDERATGKTATPHAAGAAFIRRVIEATFHSEQEPHPSKELRQMSIPQK